MHLHTSADSLLGADSTRLFRTPYVGQKLVKGLQLIPSSLHAPVGIHRTWFLHAGALVLGHRLSPRPFWVHLGWSLLLFEPRLGKPCSYWPN